MNIPFKMLACFALALPGLAVHADAAETGAVHLVAPIVAPAAVDSVEGEDDEPTCNDGLTLQENERCCPRGMVSGEPWPYVCVPDGTMERQIFNFGEITHYCPGPDMFIVSDRNRNWLSCADAGSSPLYPAAKGDAGGAFCREHGYGYLIKIDPWGQAGCVKVGDSQGDGCIEAGTCSFSGE